MKYKLVAKFNFLLLIQSVVLVAGCRQEFSNISASPEARYAFGKGSEYLANPISDNERVQIQTSVIEQRKLAWSIVEKVVEEVTPSQSRTYTVPRFATWYARNDFERWLQKSYALLSPQDRRERRDLSPLLIDQGEQHLVEQITNSTSWPTDRIDQWLNSLIGRDKWLGIMGTARTLFSPAAARHLLSSYNQINYCKPMPKTDNTESCIRGEFPTDSVIVKTAWHRHGLEFPLPNFLTSANALKRRIAPTGSSWDIPDSYSLSKPEQPGLMITTASGAEYEMTELHIMSKESRDWVWISLWWSDAPNEDFGADRPDSLKGIWSSYKMCVVTDFSDHALDDQGLNERYPSLSAALSAVKDGSGLSWCSNPYLEKGEDNQRTNCIGCHQYSATSEDSRGILSSDAFPHTGRGRDLSEFATDYLWSITSDPENLREKIRARINYHDIYD